MKQGIRMHLPTADFFCIKYYYLDLSCQGHWKVKCTTNEHLAHFTHIYGLSNQRKLGIRMHLPTADFLYKVLWPWPLGRGHIKLYLVKIKIWHNSAPFMEFITKQKLAYVISSIGHWYFFYRLWSSSTYYYTLRTTCVATRPPKLSKLTHFEP